MRRVTGPVAWTGAICAITAATILHATSIPSVSLQNLYCEADLIAFVTVLAGGGENHTVEIYRAKVSTPLKGTSSGDIIYFGPYARYRVGGEYLVFLKTTGKTLADLRSPGPPVSQATCFPDAAVYNSVMYSGYSVMPVEFTLRFRDQGVRIASQQVKLPREIEVKRIDDLDEGSFGRVWGRKDSVIRYLSTLKGRECPVPTAR